MKRHAASFAVTIALAALVYGMFAGSAWAGFGPIPSPLGTSSTNPGAMDSTETWWRGGWGNSVYPDFQAAVPDLGKDEYCIGLIYEVDSVINTPTVYPFRSASSAGTHIDGVLDLQGSLFNPPASGPHPFASGATYPIEGSWILHYRFVSNLGAMTDDVKAHFGVDLTRPAAVSGLNASPSYQAWPTGAVSPSSRVNLMWNLQQYDSVSGVAYYQVLIDGKPIAIDNTTNPAKDRVFELAPINGMSLPPVTDRITIENAPAGTHTYSVVCVDRAQNQGPAASVVYTSDPDVPTISIVSPAATALGFSPLLEVKAADAGGVASVAYRLDGTPIGTSTAAPYSLRPNLSGFPVGPHVLSATVTDSYGRTATASKSVVLDKALTITRFSRTPAVFYPIRRDRYLDNSYIYFTNNKTATVTLTVRNSSGTAVRVLKMAAAPGAHRFVWDGRWASDRRAHTGTYTYQITAADAAGFTATTGKLSTIIRNYELKRVSRSMIRVIPR